MRTLNDGPARPRFPRGHQAQDFSIDDVSIHYEARLRSTVRRLVEYVR